VDEESPSPHAKHNVTGLSYLRANGLDGEKIAGPQRWEHADSGGAQFQCPPGLQSFGRQTASAFVTGFEIHAVRGFPCDRLKVRTSKGFGRSESLLLQISR